MSTMVTELYDALRKVGVDEPTAVAAARAVMSAAQGDTLVTKADLLVTKADLQTQIAELESRLIKWNVGAMAILTAIFAAIVRLA